MYSQQDEPDFFARSADQAPSPPRPAASSGPRPAPTLEEISARVSETNQKLAELRRIQEELDRKRTALEELKRRQTELQLGRTEIVENITRGLALLEEARLKAEREAEQIARTIENLKNALEKVQAIREESWTADTFEVELTRALTAIENARMEWHTARRKHSILDGAVTEPGALTAVPGGAPIHTIAQMRMRDLCRLGLGMTWPLVLAFLLVATIALALLLKR